MAQRGETTVMAKTVAEALVSTLAERGVRSVYGIVGDSLNPVTDAIRRSGTIDWIHVRNEEAGAFAAGADAELTGKLAVCAGSCGPGNLHLINGLFDAQRNGAPVLAIAAQIPSSEIGTGYFQETHPTELFRECRDGAAGDGGRRLPASRDGAQEPELRGAGRGPGTHQRARRGSRRHPLGAGTRARVQGPRAARRRDGSERARDAAEGDDRAGQGLRARDDEDGLRGRARRRDRYHQVELEDAAMNVMRNQNGVTVGIVATTQGVELTFGDASVCTKIGKS